MKKRKILSLVLACAMLVGMVPGALAQEPATVAAKIGNDSYETLQAAVEAVSAQGSEPTVIELAANVTENISIAAGKNITLNLGGYNITNVSSHTISNSGTLTINGTGTVDNVTNDKAALYNTGTVVVNGGTYTRSQENSTANGTQGANSWYVVYNKTNATMEMTGGSIPGTSSFSSTLFNDGDLTISGGEIKGQKIAIKNDDNGKLTISGGTITDNAGPANQAIQTWSATTITGGTINGRVAVWTYRTNQNTICAGSLDMSGGEITTRDVVIAVSKNTNLTADEKLPSVKVSGDAIIAGGLGFYVHNSSTETAEATRGTIQISGGTFNGNVSHKIGETATLGTIAVTGGTFSTDPGEYINADTHHVATDANGKYVVNTGKLPEVEVGEPGFAISTSNSILGKKASDLMTGADIASGDAANPYKVTGIAKYVEGWTDFNSTVADEQSGHYLALSVTRPENFPDAGTVAVKGSKEKTWTATEFFTEENKTSETLVMRLDAITGKTFTIAFDPDGSGSQTAKTYTIDFSEMSFIVEDAVVPVEPTTTGGKASSSVNTSDLTGAIAAATTTPPTGSPAPAPVVVIDATKGSSGEISPSDAPAAAVSIPKDAVGALDTATTTKTDLTLSIATHVGTVEVDKAVINTLNEAVKDGADPVVLNVEVKTPPSGSAATHAYEINFTAGGQEIPIQGATLTITLRFSGVSDPAAVRIANNKTNTLITPTSYALVSTDTYDFTFTTTHLTQFYLTTAAATTGTVTKVETPNDGILGQTVKFSVSGAGDAVSSAYLTVSVQRGTGANAVTFCTVLPITLTDGANNNAATIYVQGGATVTGAWVTSAAPTLVSGGTVTGGILASLS